MTAHARYGRTTGVALLMRRRLAAPQRCPRPLGRIGDILYAGGAFTSVSGARREHIAALDAAKGAPTSWNPVPGGEVSSLLATRAGLLADGEFSRLAGVSVEGFGLFPPVGAADAHAAAVEGT